MTIDTNELRRKVNSTDIVDHIDLHANIKPFLSEMIDRLEAAEKERDDVAQQLVQSEIGKRKISKECESYKAAYNDWADKTEWVQQGFNEGTISAKYLGMHRADVMARLLDEAAKERQIDEGRIANLMADLNRVGHENDALRVKIEQMEKQEPIEWQTRTRPAWNDGTWGPWRKCSEEYAEDIKKTPLLYDWLYEARALYALPGAKGE